MNDKIRKLDLKPGQSLRLGPGAVIVVCQGGVLEFGRALDGVPFINIQKCDVIGTPESDAHKALVDERWSRRTEYGDFMDDPEEGSE